MPCFKQGILNIKKLLKKEIDVEDTENPEEAEAKEEKSKKITEIPKQHTARHCET